MSAAVDLSKLITVEEYLEGEELSEIRHEYHAGQIVAMAGAKVGHEIVSGNLFGALLQHLRGNPCRVFKSDMKVRAEINRDDYFYYPDILVACGKMDREAVYTEEPKLIVEVQSDRHRDLVEKLFAYQHIATLEEYLVVEQDFETPRVRAYRKSNGWKMEDGIEEERIEVRSLDLTLAVEEIYAE